jgi:hypothetical protein
MADTTDEDAEATDSETRLSIDLIDGGAELAGAVTGAAIGLIGGPGGVVAGASAGVLLTRALKRVGADLQVRLLGPRQRVRIGAAFACAAEEIQRRLDQGASPSPVWTQEGDGHRPEAEEVLEGVMLAAAEAWEERKVRHLGLLYAELAFRPFRPEYAHYLVTIARRLTWRQMVCLSILLREDHGKFRLFEYAEIVTVLENGLEAELDELGQSGIIGILQTDHTVARPSSTLGGGRMWGTPIDRVVLTTLGQVLTKAMMLQTVPEAEQQAMLESLEGRVPLRDLGSTPEHDESVR